RRLPAMKLVFAGGGARAAVAIAIGAVLLLAPRSALAQRQSGIQLGFDGSTIMVSKDVGGDRWAISYDGSTLQGNIFPQAGGAPKFVWCENTFKGDDPLLFACWQSGPCTASPCGNVAWTSIGDGIPLAASFLALPG